MALWFLLALIGIPIAEIAVFIEAGDRIGLWPTVFAIIATAAIGMTIIRIQGLAVLRRAQEQLQAEQFPGVEIFDGLCLLIAGGCLITPGFITDAFGFLLLIVPLRRWIGGWAWRYAERRGAFVSTVHAGRGQPEGGVIIDGDFQDVSAEDTDEPPSALPPAGDPPPDEDPRP